VHALTENTEHSFYEELGHVFAAVPKYHSEILLGDFTAFQHTGREDNFKLAIRNESLHETVNGIRVENFTVLKKSSC
jgi:hypothetical protein